MFSIKNKKTSSDTLNMSCQRQHWKYRPYLPLIEVHPLYSKLCMISGSMVDVVFFRHPQAYIRIFALKSCRAIHMLKTNDLQLALDYLGKLLATLNNVYLPLIMLLLFCRQDPYPLPFQSS